jgi:acetyltransferase-like isoleucine patch superfamily enzyme
VSFPWRWIDPILLKIRARMDHLQEHEPSRYAERLVRERGSFASSAIIGESARVRSVSTPDHVQVADYSYIDGEILLLTPEARCTLGRYCFLGRESRLWTQSRILIGDFVLIAPRVDIFDNDSHPLDAVTRREDAIDQFERKQPMRYDRVASADVIIEDDVWIGTKSTILKGVRIGKGAVIAAASVVTRDVPPYTLVGGNPAREIRQPEERR